MKTASILAVAVIALVLLAGVQAVRPPQILRRFLDSQPKPATELPEQWFTQILDHFNASDTRTWQQRYWVDASNHVAGGPIFIQLGEEAPMDSSYVTGLQMANYGAAHNAVLVAVEHRFYGESKPLPSLATENLRYLSVNQALADFDHFMTALKAQYNTTKVVVFGCSYIGAGTAWFMSKYPTSAVGGVASSAPVQAVVDMVTYLEQVGTSISERFGDECDARLRAGTQQIYDMLQGGHEAEVRSMFNVCPGAPLTDINNRATFMSSVAGPMMGTVQYVNENKAVPNITGVCSVIMSAPNPLAGMQAYLNMFNQGQCISADYAASIVQLRAMDQSSPNAAMRSWTWQTCTEFGYYQTTDSQKQPFAPGNMVPLSYYLQMCNDAFGIQLDVPTSVARTNAYFHGNKLTPSDIHNTVFDNSILDPWHTLSIQQSVSSSVPLLLFEVEGHCAAIMPNKPNDPASILAVRRGVAQNIAQWLA